jgi:hypothetical protein
MAGSVARREACPPTAVSAPHDRPTGGTLLSRLHIDVCPRNASWFSLASVPGRHIIASILVEGDNCRQRPN